ncbi:hypothetical protein DACRYDRAFT_24839 [Dacryopinax primogenitus]|uniref:GRIP domain-containing protein n=1 Tax=Dacryopinax primogenitus (strain DJM 731) TaxID=1858805 RepID=M5FQR9_DACPD|nr:uncharacterized protein DACRYDRAFT_24839 [Dacryopinax primogenitus]EJT97913.1 hypothetical protein DACRYDRAFT_24839 [Dacryopinax primogenitus]
MQGERLALLAVLRELTNLETLSPQGVRECLQTLLDESGKAKEEVARLQGLIKQQEERMDELRDTHRLEGVSRTQQLEQVRKQLSECEALLTAQASKSGEVDTLKLEGERLKGLVKEEEEKRGKAVQLLKSVRQKLVKAEKERDEAVSSSAAAVRNAEEAARKERDVREEFDRERERLRGEKEREVALVRRDMAAEVLRGREAAERDFRSKREKYELDAIHAKAAYDKELCFRLSRISALESSNTALSAERDHLFDELQLRQAEVESSRSALELAQAQTGELGYQLREVSDRLAVALEEVGELRRGAGGEEEGRRREVARLLAESEQRAEGRVAELRERLAALTKERQGAEEEWTRDIADRGREVERLRRVIDGKDREYAQAVREKKERDEKVDNLQLEMRRLLDRVGAGEAEVAAGRVEGERLRREEAALRRDMEVLRLRLGEREKELEEVRGREQQVRSSNKTLRDELRKVQSSAALLERGRNPGVGYFSARTGITSPPNGDASGSTSDILSRSSTDNGNGNGYPTASAPAPGSPARSEASLSKNEEEVNLEYLRNVILQFLEHKEMRPNLVRVLSVILRFTPQETRRLVSKVGN